MNLDLGMKHIRKCTPTYEPDFFEIRFERRVDGEHFMEYRQKFIIEEHESEDAALEYVKGKRDQKWIELRHGKPKMQRTSDARNKSGVVGLSAYVKRTNGRKYHYWSARRFEETASGTIRDYKHFRFRPYLKGDKERAKLEAMEWMEK